MVATENLRSKATALVQNGGHLFEHIVVIFREGYMVWIQKSPTDKTIRILPIFC